MTSDVSQIKDVIEIARDGVQLYERAWTQLTDANLRRVFIQMAKAKRELIAALGDHLTVSGAYVPQAGTVAGTVRHTYATLRAKLSRADDKMYVAQLQHMEDRLLHQVETAIQVVRDPEVRGHLEDYLPKIRACHAEMRHLQYERRA